MNPCVVRAKSHNKTADRVWHIDFAQLGSSREEDQRSDFELQNHAPTAERPISSVEKSVRPDVHISATVY
jgi:hypothetical protein